MFRGIRFSALRRDLVGARRPLRLRGWQRLWRQHSLGKRGPLVRGEAVQMARADAAGARPVTGDSVTQSSEIGSSGTTMGVVTVTVSEDRFDNLEVSVMFNRDDGVDTEHASAESGKGSSGWLTGRKAPGSTSDSPMASASTGVSLTKTLPTRRRETSGSMSRPTSMGNDNDGHQLYRRRILGVHPGRREEDPSFGVFVDGVTHSDGTAILALAGEADYLGEATGIYSSRGGRKTTSSMRRSR